MRCDVMLYDLTRCDFKLCDSDAIPMWCDVRAVYRILHQLTFDIKRCEPSL